ncbi:hypothetical protein [Streptomyces sp. NPDC056387]|uniref:hypothetical protein n=1 Tax=Streptomyces sp. NPDC056387 TaxID=3345803 RepID=UPI0035D6A82A
MTSFVVDCDICLRSLETGDHVALFATQAEADEQADAAGWTQTGVGMACPREDISHRLARGTPTP